MKASYVALNGEHAGLLHCLHSAVAEDYWSELSFKTHFESKNTLTIGALFEGQIVGFVACLVIGNSEADILQIAVAKPFQRQGIASGLIDSLKESGLLSIALEVRTTNLPAILLYERHGFKAVGKRPGFYSDGADAVTMRWNKIS